MLEYTPIISITGLCRNTTLSAWAYRENWQVAVCYTGVEKTCLAADHFHQLFYFDSFEDF